MENLENLPSTVFGFNSLSLFSVKLNNGLFKSDKQKKFMLSACFSKYPSNAKETFEKLLECKIPIGAYAIIDNNDYSFKKTIYIMDANGILEEYQYNVIKKSFKKGLSFGRQVSSIDAYLNKLREEEEKLKQTHMKQGIVFDKRVTIKGIATFRKEINKFTGFQDTVMILSWNNYELQGSVPKNLLEFMSRNNCTMKDVDGFEVTVDASIKASKDYKKFYFKRPTKAFFSDKTEVAMLLLKIHK